MSVHEEVIERPAPWRIDQAVRTADEGVGRCLGIVVVDKPHAATVVAEREAAPVRTLLLLREAESLDPVGLRGGLGVGAQ